MRLYKLKKIKAGFLKRFHLFCGTGFSIGKAYNSLFLFDWKNAVDKKTAAELYEWGQIHLFIKYAIDHKPSKFIDVGACFGLFSIIMKNYFPNIEIHAFEPDKVSRSQFYANLFINNMSHDITIYDSGISNTSGTTNFNAIQDDYSIKGGQHISNDGNITIPIYALDDLFKSSSETIFIKIDIEGHEYKALLGAEKLLLNNNCIIMIECFKDFDDVNNLMKKYGYRIISKIRSGDYFFSNLKID